MNEGSDEDTATFPGDGSEIVDLAANAGRVAKSVEIRFGVAPGHRLLGSGGKIKGLGCWGLVPGVIPTARISDSQGIPLLG